MVDRSQFVATLWPALRAGNAGLCISRGIAIRHRLVGRLGAILRWVWIRNAVLGATSLPVLKAPRDHLLALAGSLRRLLVLRWLPSRRIDITRLGWIRNAVIRALGLPGLLTGRDDLLARRCDAYRTLAHRRLPGLRRKVR